MAALLSPAAPALLRSDQHPRLATGSGARSARRWWRGLLPIGLVAVAVLPLTGTLEVDSFYALYTGRVVAASGPPHAEVLTSAASHSWTDQQWLAQWLFFEMDRLGGLAAVALMCVAATTLAGVLLARMSARRGGALPVAWATLGVVAVGFITIARTQTLVYPLFVALLWLLTGVHRADRWQARAVFAVPLLVLWANMHGSVLLGVALTVACMSVWAVRLARGGRTRDAFAAVRVGIAAVLSIFTTPYGLSIVHYYSSLMGNGTLRAEVSDWQRTSLLSLAVTPFLVLCALTVLSLAAGARKHPSKLWRAELLAVALLVALAFYSGRYVVWAALTLPYIASTFGAMRPLRIPARVTVVARALSATALVVLLVALATTRDDTFSKGLPLRVASAAAEVAADDVVLADQSTSTALLWRHPQTAGHVAFDIRYEQYREADIAAYFRFLQAKKPSLACRYGAVAISAKERPKLVRVIRTDPTWTPTYDGRDGIVAVRTPETACT